MEVQLIYTAAEIRDLEAERDSQRDRADSKQRGWDEANRQLDAMAAERDSLKAKLVEAEAKTEEVRHLYGYKALQDERDALKAALVDMSGANAAEVRRRRALDLTAEEVEALRDLLGYLGPRVLREWKTTAPGMAVLDKLISMPMAKLLAQ